MSLSQAGAAAGLVATRGRQSLFLARAVELVGEETRERLCSRDEGHRHAGSWWEKKGMKAQKQYLWSLESGIVFALK